MRSFIVTLVSAVAASAIPLEQAPAATTSTTSSPLAYSSACKATATEYKTHEVTEKITTCTTKTIYTETCTASTVTTTLSPGCPTIPIITPITIESTIATLSATSSSTSTCPATTTVTSKVTSTITKTKTKTEKVKTATTVTPTAAITPSVFYLRSTHDSTYALLDPSGSYSTVTLGHPCNTTSTPLYALNTTTSQLSTPSTGYIATNIACCGGAGLPFAFSDPDGVGEGVEALSCAVDGVGALSCGLPGGDAYAWADCDGELVLGGSHLCDVTSVVVVQPMFY